MLGRCPCVGGSHEQIPTFSVDVQHCAYESNLPDSFVRRSFPFVILFVLTSGCSSLPDPHYPAYGWIVDQGQDPHGQGIKLTIPAHAPSISQRFEPSENLERGARGTKPAFHQGIDIVGRIGDQVIAVGNGQVISSKRTMLAGNTIIIDHGLDAYHRRILTAYAHLNGRHVKKGERVVQGQQIGDLGKTGLLAHSPHLHYAVFEAQGRGPFQQRKGLNPHLFWANGVGNITCYDPKRRFDAQPFRFTYPVLCRAEK